MSLELHTCQHGYGLYKECQDKMAELQAEVERLKRELKNICSDDDCIYLREAKELKDALGKCVEALEDFGTHDKECVLAQWHWKFDIK